MKTEIHQSFRHGFTVIELLVSTTVIGVLISLLLPAVQTAREAARQTQCRNNMRQVGLALHNFESTYKMFPASGWTKTSIANPAGRFVGWRASLMPYLEQSNVFHSYDFDEDWWHSTNLRAGTIAIPVFQCPSTPQQTPISFAVKKAPRPMIRFPAPIASADYEALMGIRSVIDPVTYPDRQKTRSVLYRNSKTRFADIIDGTSNTIMITECAGRPFVYQRRILQADLTNDQGFGWIDSESGFSLDGTCVDGSRQGLGPTETTAGINATNENEPYAFHSGGAMFLFADGHVSFLSETIELKLLAMLVTKAGGESVTANGH